MKNKNNFSITVGIIAAFLIVIIAGSTLFSGYMGSGNETDNTLNAEIQPTGTDRIVFDYPYIDVKDLESHKEEQYYPYYKYESANIDNQIIPMEHIDVDDTMIDYQQAANIGGELIKFLYGDTYHQTMPAMLACVEQDSLKQYCYALWNRSDNLPFMTNIRRCIDATTGKVLAFVCNRNDKFTPVENIEDKFSEEITSDIKATLDAKVKTDLQLLGFNSEYQTTEYEIYIDKIGGAVEYRVYFDIAGENRVLEYKTVDNQYFEVIRFALSQYDRNNRTVYRY